MPRPGEDRSDVGGAAQFNNIGPVPLSRLSRKLSRKILLQFLSRRATRGFGFEIIGSSGLRTSPLFTVVGGDIRTSSENSVGNILALPRKKQDTTATSTEEAGYYGNIDRCVNRRRNCDVQLRSRDVTVRMLHPAREPERRDAGPVRTAWSPPRLWEWYRLWFWFRLG